MPCTVRDLRLPVAHAEAQSRRRPSQSEPPAARSLLLMSVWKVFNATSLAFNADLHGDYLICGIHTLTDFRRQGFSCSLLLFGFGFGLFVFTFSRMLIDSAQRPCPFSERALAEILSEFPHSPCQCSMAIIN